MKLVIFGCGNIANRIGKSCLLCEDIELVGFASKDINKAKEYALKYGNGLSGDYDYFLNSDVENVYIATYNPGHYELIKQCLKHHKNVICEKPMLSNKEDTKELFKYAKDNNLLLMEALKSVFLPIIIKTKQLIADGRLGRINEVSASFMRNGNHPDNHWINDPKTGGALKDLGTYCVGTLNYLMYGVPEIVKIETDRKIDKADTTTYLDLKYGDIIGKVKVSNSIDGDCDLIVKGDKGYIRIHDFWKTNKAELVIESKQEIIEEELISDFYYELKEFAYLVDHNMIESKIMSEEFSLGILEITGGHENDYSK